MIKSDAFIFIFIDHSESNTFNIDALIHVCLMLSNVFWFLLFHFNDLFLFIKFVNDVIL